jgi:MSHA biogenesis protein MshQ
MYLLHRYRSWLLAFLASWCALSALAATPTPNPQARSYNIPADLNKLFSNLQYPCTSSGSVYTCQGNPTIDKESILNITAPITLRIVGTFSANAPLFVRVPSASNPFYFQIDGNFNTNAPMDIKAAYLDVGGTFATSKDVTITANIRVGAQMAIRSDTIVYGDVTAGSEIMIEGNSVVYGKCTAPYGNYPPKCTGGVPPPAASTLHHVRLVHTGSAATCTPALITVHACAGADSGNSCTAYTAGVSGTVSGGGVSAAFSIPSGSSSATASLAVTAPATVTLAASGFTASSSPIYTCWNGSAASCSLAFADSALLLSVPDHKSGVATDFTVKAVRKSDKANVCTPAFQGARAIRFGCSYSNPTTGTKALAIGAKGGTAASLACASGTTASATLTFDSTGSAPGTLTYADAGALALTATDPATSITGTDTFIVAPYRLAFTKTPATTTPVRAGTAFTVNVAAQNSSGVATPNFGKETTPETVSIAVVLSRPATSDGGVAGETRNGASTSVAAGVASASPSWTETGIASLSARLTSDGYLGSTQVPASATAAEVLYSIPDHYDVAVLPAVKRDVSVPGATETTLPWWYSSQPIGDVTITAREYNGGPTTNFGKELDTGGTDGTVTLVATSASTPAGTLANHTRGTSQFSGGVARPAPEYSLPTLESAPRVVALAAKGIGELETDRAGTSGSVIIRSGRLLLSRATAGALATTAQMPVTAQYWSGTSWVKNGDDSFTAFPAGSAGVSQNGAKLDDAGIGAAKLASGSGYLTVSRPATGKAVLNVALNLGAGAADVSCLAVHPASAPARHHWLRSRYGDCSNQADPWAPVVFGGARPESKAIVHVREVYN